MTELVDLPETAIEETNNLNIEQIRAMIAKLATTEDGENLKNAMDELQEALKQNPAACSFMLPEDIGECVGHLQRMTQKNIMEDLNEKAKKTPKNPIITKEILDNLTMDDLK